ncbi:indolepyruvate oxidoreductase subunit beta family protein [Eoetvoesiella caeni]
MSAHDRLRPLKIAILAMGGEGGGVLADWIVAAAESQGFYAQSTSVPGVAQRTGSTIYYVELLPVQRTAGRTPVFALMPTPGDVDVVIASELMECGRAIQRGFVTPDKTLLITSSHRVYALPEKMAMGDGRVDENSFLQAGKNTAREFVCRDFAALAERRRSVISSALFGALTASGVVPWPREVSEQAIQKSGIGVAASLAAFADGSESYCNLADATKPLERAMGESASSTLQGLLDRVESNFPVAVWDMVSTGAARAADYQSFAYAELYLQRLESLCAIEAKRGTVDPVLLRETARYLALWMTYEDTARVADLKIRGARFARVRSDEGIASGDLMHIHEYFHPRLEEIADSLPSWAGRWLMQPSWAGRLIQRITRKGRVIRTSSLGGFCLLYLVSSMRAVRMSSLRYQRENADIEAWLGRIVATADSNYELACELAECQRLIKGYGDTHLRGSTNYRAIWQRLDQLRGTAAAATLRRWREAALLDEDGEGLRQAMAEFAEHTVPEAIHPRVSAAS